MWYNFMRIEWDRWPHWNGDENASHSPLCREPRTPPIVRKAKLLSNSLRPRTTTIIASRRCLLRSIQIHRNRCISMPSAANILIIDAMISTNVDDDIEQYLLPKSAIEASSSEYFEIRRSIKARTMTRRRISPSFAHALVFWNDIVGASIIAIVDACVEEHTAMTCFMIIEHAKNSWHRIPFYWRYFSIAGSESVRKDSYYIYLMSRFFTMWSSITMLNELLYATNSRRDSELMLLGDAIHAFLLIIIKCWRLSTTTLADIIR